MYNGQVKLLSVALIGLGLLTASCSSSILTRGSDSAVEMEEEFAEMVQVEVIPGKSDEPDKKPVQESKESLEKKKKEEQALKEQMARAKKEEGKRANAQEAGRENKKAPINPEPQKTKKPKKRESAPKKADKPDKNAEEEIEIAELDPNIHLPEIEDGRRFRGRRPIIDPFWPGEKMKLRVTYFGVTAGYLTIETGQYVQVNGRKHYNFVMRLESSDTFSLFYKVQDRADTYVDFENLLPTSFKLDVKESGQLRDTKAFFDHETGQATMWEKKYTESKGEQNRKVVWQMEPYAQNVFSASFYMRLFPFVVGEEYAFRVADDGKNLLFRGRVVRKERLKTDAGTFDTIVLKPEVDVGGVMAPTGDIFFWLTDDDRRMIVKIESKIKIGTIKAFIEKLDYGTPPPEATEEP